MTAEQAIHAFWSSFGLAAYDEYSVPDTAQLPYITYSFSYDSIGYTVNMAASLWTHSTSWKGITAKANEIVNKIKAGGIMLPCDNGGIWITAGNPLYQRMENSGTDTKRIYLNIQAEYIIGY